MKRSRAFALATAALVAGLALGSIGIAQAAPATDPATGQTLGYGLRIGYALRDAGGRMVDILADLTGLSTTDIHDRRVAGESVADIAKSENVDPSSVVDKALEVRKEVLDQKVADGTIDTATRDQILSTMSDRLNERVNSTQVGGYGRGGGMGGGMGGRGMGAGACGGACDGTGPVSTNP